MSNTEESQEEGSEGAKKVKTRITCRAEGAQSVWIAGSFNDWKPDEFPMEWQPESVPSGDDDVGIWVVELELLPGRHEFKFVVDGEWCCSPDCSGDHVCPDCVENGHGSMNRVLEVGG